MLSNEFAVPFDVPAATPVVVGPAKGVKIPYLLYRIVRLLFVSAIYTLPAISVVREEGILSSRGRPVLLSIAVDTVFVVKFIIRIILFSVSATYRYPVATSNDRSLGPLKVEFTRGPFTLPAEPATPAIVVTVAEVTLVPALLTEFVNEIFRIV